MYNTMNIKKEQRSPNWETILKSVSYGNSPLKMTKVVDNLTQEEIEQLTPEQYSNYIAYGEVELPILNEDEYERYLLGHRLFDL